MIMGRVLLVDDDPGMIHQSMLIATVTGWWQGRH
jgi:hypothetical protein